MWWLKLGTEYSNPPISFGKITNEKLEWEKGTQENKFSFNPKNSFVCIHALTSKESTLRSMTTWDRQSILNNMLEFNYKTFLNADDVSVDIQMLIWMIMSKPVIWNEMASL